ncbi:hypothetical protein ACTGWE_11910, partial [Streptococcus suis]
MGSSAAGNINLGGSLLAPTAVVSLITSGAGTFTDVGLATAQAKTLNLTNAAAIGAVGSPYNTNATNLSVVTTGLVDIQNQAAGGV